MKPSEPDDAGQSRRRRWFRWLAPVAGLVLLPKCALCWLAYASMAAGARWELCGDTAGSSGGSCWPSLALTFACSAAIVLTLRQLRARTLF